MHYTPDRLGLAPGLIICLRAARGLRIDAEVGSQLTLARLRINWLLVTRRLETRG